MQTQLSPARVRTSSDVEDTHAQLLQTLRAFRRGDFDVQLSDSHPGILGEIAVELNELVATNRRLADELSRVSRVVGKQGQLAERAHYANVEGSWRTYIDATNDLISDLIQPTTEVARVIGAVASGDLTQEMALHLGGRALEGEFAGNAQVVNAMVQQLSVFAREVTRVAREVATEGKLGGQAQVKGVAGTWKDLTDCVNLMAGNLAEQVRNIAEVTTAVATGDLSKQITVDVRGEVLELKNTINTMVGRLNAFAGEVTRVAREVGTEGKLGGQARVPGASGTWKDLTDSVNRMAGNLTAQVRNIAEVTTAVATGDLSKTITVDVQGEILELKNTINTMVDRLNAFAGEVTRVAREVGTEGKLGGQAKVPGVSGTWADLTDSVNSMASNLTNQVRNIADVTTAVARGDLSKKITVDVRGEILALKDTINTMVDQLNAFASEVTRVAREVGTEGRLGGQAYVKGAAGTWKDLTDSVNSMASNLTSQVRGIAKVVTAVAQGDLTQQLRFEARGEIAELAGTINSMIQILAIFAEQVITVAREVGVQGRLGGQAKVPGVAGTWSDLVDNVNQLAANLTTQVRAIGDVATAVTKGDLTRHVTVEASGEVAALKDNINEMIRNLKDTTQKTTEQDWLKTNLARFTRMLQGQRDLVSVARQILSELALLVGHQYGAFYLTESDATAHLRLLASYASSSAKHSFELGEGLVGQCALEKRKIQANGVPTHHVRIESGLGESAPRYILILPVLFEGQVNAVIELASFERLSDVHQVFLDQLTESIGIVINTIAASMRTETLLLQSQSLTQVLQSQQEELRQTNERLERQAATLRESEERLRLQSEELRATNEQLEDKAELLELKKREVEVAKAEVEEKAEQLALTSKYKSEFLANMSHELRTPLNSLLILSRMLSENLEGNLTSKQVEFARTIHASGTDLLELISDILDLSKIESGTIAVERRAVSLGDLQTYVQQNFSHIAQQKGLGFGVNLESMRVTSVMTDAKRLQQVLKNLLSNALKFTEHGCVTLDIKAVEYGWSRDNESLNRADAVVAFAVTDTGIGIPEAKQRIIFEAFQQADGTTNRKYGGTGLGLSISREIANLLGGELRVVSIPGRGSTFTFYLPRDRAPIALASGLDGASGVEEIRHDNPPSKSQLVPLERVRADMIADGELVEPSARRVLAIDDDPQSVEMLRELAQVRGTKVIVVADGDSGLDYARRFKPSGICLSMPLRDCDGWTILDRLKRDPMTQHLPVAVVSAEDHARRARCLGATCLIKRPAQASALSSLLDRFERLSGSAARRLLIVENDVERQQQLRDTLAGDEIEFIWVTEEFPGIDSIGDRDIDCMIVDVEHEAPSRYSLLYDAVERPEWAHTGLIALCPITLSAVELDRLRRCGIATVTSDHRMLARLLRETARRLHRSDALWSLAQQKILRQSPESETDLGGATILVIDDDVRNIFAITSALERFGARVVFAENGRDGLAMLENQPEVRAVFTDIMMPEIDGYEVMRRIRSKPRFAELPVIAVTAKAMQNDREKCLSAGASDYIAKPVDVGQLESLLRIWLPG